MSKNTARVAILSAVKLVWPPDFGLLSVPNVNFTIPNNSRWGAVRINDNGTDRRSLGADYLKRSVGSLQFDLYAPSNTGTRENTEASDFLEEFFDSRELLTSDDEMIVFQTPYSLDVSGVQERQDGTNSNWYRRIVDCPFYRDSHFIK